MALVVALHGGDLGRLVLERVEAVRVAGENLQRVTMAAIHMAMENMIRAWRLVLSFIRCQAPTAPTAKAVVRKAASTVCTRR